MHGVVLAQSDGAGSTGPEPASRQVAPLATPRPSTLPPSPTGTIVARDVVVQQGDTLADIALRELGLAGHVSALADFNALDPDAALAPGERVLVPRFVPQRGERAVVVFAKGETSRNGEPLERDADVVAGDVIRTGADGFVALEFASGAVVNLQPDTQATLEQLACEASDDNCLIELDAERGGLDADVDARDDQPTEFRITTPFSSAAVRGTRFDLAVDAGAMRVAVTEGAVLTRAQGSSVPLDEGFGSVTREGEPPGQAQALLPPPVFRNVPLRVAPGDRVRWWPLSDVQRYALAVSLDSAGTLGVAAVEVEGATSPLAELSPPIEPGDYFLQLRGIDASELPGLRSSTRVVVADVDAALAAPAVTIERQGSDVLVAVADPAPDATGYEIQIATGDDFADPLAVDVGPGGRAVFRVESDTIRARARQLVTPTSVSAFGEAALLR